MSRRDGNADVSRVVAEHLCLGCGACSAACGTDSISFRETAGGLVFPRIDPETCTRCGLCYEVCPGRRFGRTLTEEIPRDPFAGEVIACEIGRAADEAVFANSQSGGVATALLTHLFETGRIKAALVAVMRTAVPPRGAVLLATGAGELAQAQKSKYTPIPMLTGVKALARVDGDVAIVGLPCHFHGLHNLLDECPILDRSRIFRIGLVCERIMTAAAIDFMAGRATGGRVNGFTFKDKACPSYPGNPVVEREDGGRVVLDASLRHAIKDYFTPARCRLCFDKLNVFADVTLGDPHGVPGADTFRGETLVLARTARGKELVEEARLRGAVTLRNVEASVALAGAGKTAKRREWAGYMRAWKRSGRNAPEYPFPAPDDGADGRCERWMDHSLWLDDVASREELLRAANRWLAAREAKRWLKSPLRKLKELLRKRTP
jgi:coenzyme F420 hydrogenase subunit beta